MGGPVSRSFFMVLAILLSVSVVADDSARMVRAIRDNDVRQIELLLNNGASSNVMTRDGKTMLMAAAAAGYLSLVGRLLDSGSPVNAVNDRGGDALMYAASYGRVKVIRYLLGKNARPARRAQNGWTALTLAVAKGHTPVVRVLLDAGVDPNTADVFGWTPLMRGVANNKAGSVRLLLGHTGTDINRRNANGQHALHIAVDSGSCDMIGLLESAGADAGIADAAGRTVFDYVQRSGRCAEELSR